MGGGGNGPCDKLSWTNMRFLYNVLYASHVVPSFTHAILPLTFTMLRKARHGTAWHGTDTVIFICSINTCLPSLKTVMFLKPPLVFASQTHDKRIRPRKLPTPIPILQAGPSLWFCFLTLLYRNRTVHSLNGLVQ